MGAMMNITGHMAVLTILNPKKPKPKLGEYHSIQLKTN